MSEQDFDTALRAYVNYACGHSTAHTRLMSGENVSVAFREFTIDNNPKYVRINSAGYGQTSVYGFVRRSDGAIMYGAGWKAPFIAKADKGRADADQSPATKRGSIYDPSTWEACTGWSAVKTIR